MSKQRSAEEGKLDDPLLAAHADAIRLLGKRVVDDVSEIGKRLKECKRLAGHGNWLPWLDREFGWDERTAQRFIAVHELSLKSDNLSDLELSVSGLYLLAAPSTPVEAREIIEQAAAGKKVSTAGVKATIARAKSGSR